MATPIGAIDRYVYRGSLAIYWSTSIADIEAVSRAELDGATDLTAETTAAIGWEISSDLVVDPQWAAFSAQRPGRVSVGTPELVMRADRAGDDIRTVLSRSTSGWVLLLFSGDEEGNPMNVYPVTVAGVPQPVTVDAIAHLRVQFAVTSEPAADVTVPS